VGAAVYLTLLFPLSAVPLERLLAERSDPRFATWLLSCASVVLAGTSCAALGLLTLSEAVRIPLVDRLGHLSTLAVDSRDPTEESIALAAGLLFGAALLAAAAFAVRRARALADAFRHARGLPGPDSLVITRDETANAYTVPGRPSRIVVSRGMLLALDEAGRTALLAHERAHAEGHHYLYTSVARLAAAANPLLRPLAAAVEYTVERWADEQAAAQVGDRGAVARAIAHAALAAKASGTRRGPATALGAVFSRPEPGLHAAGPVPRRVAALLGPPPLQRPAITVGTLAFLALCAYTALHAADNLQDLLAFAHTTARP
jgi:hypothetical protein